jgi:molybdopterin-containing oxidoreductase family iron-sulfur binding subunit
MVIDLDKCTGCQACTTACAMENNRLPGENWQDVLFYSEGSYPNVNMKWFPRPCMHCENPSCVSACPTRATYKDPDGGFVLIDWNKCIGCKACMVACPWGAEQWNPRTEKAVKCDLCMDRLDQGLQPVCGTVCTTQCLSLVKIDAAPKE